MLKKLNKWFDFLLEIIDTLACVMLLLIIVSILLQVLFRQLSLNIQWTEEVARYSFVYLVFMGGVSATRKTAHIAITTLVDALPAGLYRWVDVAVHLLVAGMSLILAYSSVVLSRSASGVTSSVIQWFQMNYLYIPIGVTCVLMVLGALLRIVDVVVDSTLIVRERELRANEYGQEG